MDNTSCIDFDLTTIDGLRKIKWQPNDDDNSSIGSIVTEAVSATVIGAAGTGVVVGGAAANGGILSSIGSIIRNLFRKQETTNINQTKKIPPDTQLKLAQNIIAAGSKNGVKKLKITIDKDVGGSLGASYVGASLKGQIGTDGKFHLEVEYK